MKNHIKVLVLFCLIISNNLYGQIQYISRLDGSKISIQEIDQSVKLLMERAKVPGIGLAILNNNKVSYIKSYGYKNKATGELLDTSSIVYAASFSKAVCAFLCMKLVKQKILDLDKPLSEYLSKPISSYKSFSELQSDDRWKKITARMCLSHTTGFPNLRWFDPTGRSPEYDSLGVVKIYFEPGSKYAYSGEGFKFLQLVLEEITGKSFDSLASEFIFKPLGMLRSGYVWHDNLGDDLAVGHNENELPNVKSKKSVAVAGGSMVTTISDYSKFIEYIMENLQKNNSFLKQMIKPQIRIYSKTQFPPITHEITNENENIELSYGLGWGLMKTPYGRAFFKEGGDDAWKNYNINFVDKGISIIMICNSVNGSKMFKDLLEKLIGDTFTPWKWEEYYPVGYNPL